MTDAPRPISLSEIDEGAITRDRTGLDPEPLAELQHSICISGLRTPVEVYPLPAPRDGKLYGLIAGYRRFFVFRKLHEQTGLDKWESIPAVVRADRGAAAAMAAMVEENEIRAQVSPYERGRIAYRGWKEGVFVSIEDAVAQLYPTADRQKRSRLRTIAFLAEELDGYLSAPEKLTYRQLARLSRAVTGGFGELLRTALEESSVTDHEHQLDLIEPVLYEFEENEKRPERSSGPGRPRRIVRPRHGLTVRRVRLKDGWAIFFTGRESTGPVIDLVIDDIVRTYMPG